MLPDEQAERDVDVEYDRFTEMLIERHMTLEQYLATCPDAPKEDK